MKILLVDVDSTIPNLALMKLSAYYKAGGHKVGFNTNNPDRIFISCLYPKNAWLARGVQKLSTTMTRLGGSGISLSSKLPPNIEGIKPDYDLYPSTYSQGFTTRGCIRRCDFCVVPKKEGPFRRTQHPEKFHDDRFSEIMIMDNNWLADLAWFKKTAGWIIDRGLAVREHGMDIRLVTPEVAGILAEMTVTPTYHFAFDDEDLEPVVREKCQLLRDAGIDIRHDVQFYVYMEDDYAFRSALYRCRVLKAIGTNAFVMFNIDNPTTTRVNQLRRWANRKQLFWSFDFCEYDRTKDRVRTEGC